MFNIQTCVAVLVLGAFLYIDSSSASTTKAPVTLDALLTNQSAAIVAVFNKYKGKAEIDYEQFILDIKAAEGYQAFKTRLKELYGEDDIKVSQLETLVPKSNGMRNYISVGSVVMVAVVTMLLPFLN